MHGIDRPILLQTYISDEKLASFLSNCASHEYICVNKDKGLWRKLQVQANRKIEKSLPTDYSHIGNGIPANAQLSRLSLCSCHRANSCIRRMGTTALILAWQLLLTIQFQKAKSCSRCKMLSLTNSSCLFQGFSSYLNTAILGIFRHQLPLMTQSPASSSWQNLRNICRRQHAAIDISYFFLFNIMIIRQANIVYRYNSCQLSQDDEIVYGTKNSEFLEIYEDIVA